MDRKRLQEIWEDGLHHRSFVAGGILTVLMLSLAILSLIWTPYSFFTMNIAGKLQPPGELHWLGTDHFGSHRFGGFDRHTSRLNCIRPKRMDR